MQPSPAFPAPRTGPSGGRRGGGWFHVCQFSFACLPATLVARFPTGHGPVLIHGPGVGDPCSKGLSFLRQCDQGNHPQLPLGGLSQTPPHVWVLPNPLVACPFLPPSLEITTFASGPLSAEWRPWSGPLTSLGQLPQRLGPLLAQLLVGWRVKARRSDLPGLPFPF